MRWRQKIQAFPKELLIGIIILLILAGMADSYALARSYGERNADTVVIVATVHLNGRLGQNPDDYLLKPQVTLRFTGATAHQVQEALAFYPYYNAVAECLLDGTSYSYDYQLTFTLHGIVVEVAHAPADSCAWTFSSLGVSVIRGDNVHAVERQLVELTHQALPTGSNPALITP